MVPHYVQTHEPVRRSTPLDTFTLRQPAVDASPRQLLCCASAAVTVAASLMLRTRVPKPDQDSGPWEATRLRACKLFQLAGRLSLAACDYGVAAVMVTRAYNTLVPLLKQRPLSSYALLALTGCYDILTRCDKDLLRGDNAVQAVAAAVVFELCTAAYAQANPAPYATEVYEDSFVRKAGELTPGTVPLSWLLALAANPHPFQRLARDNLTIGGMGRCLSLMIELRALHETLAGLEPSLAGKLTTLSLPKPVADLAPLLVRSPVEAFAALAKHKDDLLYLELGAKVHQLLSCFLSKLVCCSVVCQRDSPKPGWMDGML